MNLASSTSPLVISDSYDLSNAVAFAAGVDAKFFYMAQRKSAAVDLSHLLNDKDMQILRSLCSMRSIIMKNYTRITNIPDAEGTPLDILLHFPGFIESNLPIGYQNLLKMTGPLEQRVRLINEEITKGVFTLHRYIPCEEPHADWILSLFDFPEYESDEQLKSICADFCKRRAYYPWRVYINCQPSITMFNSDYFLMFQVYKKFDALLPDRSLYKVVRSAQFAKASYDTVPGSGKAFEFLKAAFSEHDTHSVFFVDTQNMNANVVYEFLAWLETEYPDFSGDIYLYVDGRENWMWNMAEVRCKIPIHRINSPRVLLGKSSVDTMMASSVVKVFYEENPDYIFVFSSDCDFLPLCQVLPEATFCFCGISGSISQKSIANLETCKNAFYIVIVEFLGCMKAYGKGRNAFTDELAYLLNKKRINAASIIEQVRPVCQYLGRRNDDVITVSLLNQVFSTLDLRVSEDGCLDFKPPWEHWA